METISVIIPIYNASNYIAFTMECLLRQKYTNFEIIAVNDCSTDNTENIISLYIPQFLNKGIELKLVNREKNGGLCAAINSGLAIANGEYLCFPDSDDELSENYLLKMYEALNNNPEKNWVRCNYTIVLEDENREYDVLLPTQSVYEDDYYDFISKFVAHNAWNMLVRKKYFMQVIGNRIYDSRLTQEWSILLPLSFHSNYLRCEEKLYRYYIRNKAMSSWQNGEIKDVIEHIDGLEKLNLDIIGRLGDNSEKRIVISREAIRIYYIYLRYKKYKQNNVIELEEETKKIIFEEAGKYISKKEIIKLDNPDIIIRLLFDKLLGGNIEDSINIFNKFLKLTADGYEIVFDDGGSELISVIEHIYGKASNVYSYEDFLTKAENVKIIIALIQNSKTYSKTEKDGKGKYQFIEYRSVRDSIRGWAALNSI